MKAIDYIVLVVALLLIVLVMMQESKDNIQDAFSGEKSDLFKNQKQRGIKIFLVDIEGRWMVLYSSAVESGPLREGSAGGASGS